MTLSSQPPNPYSVPTAHKEHVPEIVLLVLQNVAGT